MVEPHDGTAPLAWHVAADDRWHDPLTDTGVRHRRVAGTAVFETKVRIPGGDAVQRVWSVADADGYTLISVHNDSPAPIAVAFTRGDLATSRPAAELPIEGITLPSDSVVFPVGHRATITVGLAHGRRGASTLPPGLATADAVVRGWVTRTDVASRLDVPEQTLVDAVRAARCELLLDGVADVDAEPERHLLGLCELLRLGDLDARGAADAAPRIADAVAAVVRRRDWLGSAALDAAAVVLAAAGERRALADLACLRAAVTNSVTPGGTSLEVPPDDVAAIPMVERRLAAGSMVFPSRYSRTVARPRFRGPRPPRRPGVAAVPRCPMAWRQRRRAVGGRRRAGHAQVDGRGVAVVLRPTPRRGPLAVRPGRRELTA